MYNNQKLTLAERAARIKDLVPMMDIMSQYVTLQKDGHLFKGLCPFHQERTPSFFIYDNRTYCCFGCNAKGSIIDFLMAKHGLTCDQAITWLETRYIGPAQAHNITLPKLPPKQKTTSEAVNIKDYDAIPPFDKDRIFRIKDSAFVSRRADHLYEYTYADGQPYGYMLVQRDEDTGKKRVSPISLYECPKLGLLWAFKGMGAPRPLYNLRELMRNTSKPVLVVEGEKCAEAAKRLLKEFVVVTWAHGANSTDKTDWSPLEQREVFIWPDNDDTGREAANKISKDLQYAEIVKYGDGKPNGWDIADEIANGKTEQELTDIILQFRVPRKQEEYKPITNEDLPPGLLGDVTRYILASSTIEHPILATGAAIAVLAILQAQKCTTEDNIHPNIYVVTLAPSGAGKSFPLEITKSILAAIGCEKLISGMPASGAGLISALHRRLGRAFLPIDEFGKVFASIVDPSSSNYRQDIVTKLLTLFSNSNSQYTDDEYSDREKQKEIRIIRKPNLVIYGTTIPDNFYESMNAEEGASGFLARLLVLSGVDSQAIRKSADQVTRSMPENLKEVLSLWAYDPTNVMGYDENNYDFAPQVIKYESAARKILEIYGEASVKISQEAEAKGDEFRSSLYRRCFEKVSKLALLARTNNQYIDVAAVEWAIKFVSDATERYYNEAKKFMHDGQFSKNSKKIERYLQKKEKWISKTELTNRFRMPLKSMKEILDYLMESNIIEHKSFKNKNATVATLLYRYNFQKD